MDRINELTKEQQEEKKLFLSKINDKVKFVNARNRFANTDFLDLAEQQEAIEFLSKIKFENYELNGGYENAERKVLILYPAENRYDYEEIEETSNSKILNQIMCIARIDLPKDLWGSYEHATYLGALMKLGLKREKIGDIIVRPSGADIIVSTDIKKFMEDSVKLLTRFQKSDIKILNLSELNYVAPTKKVFKINVPSMRLDAVVGELARVSRADSSRLLEEERVFVNFKTEIRGTKQVKEEDYITIRGKGRFKILKILGTTRSGRFNLEVEK